MFFFYLSVLWPFYRHNWRGSFNKTNWFVCVSNSEEKYRTIITLVKKKKTQFTLSVTNIKNNTTRFHEFIYVEILSIFQKILHRLLRMKHDVFPGIWNEHLKYRQHKFFKHFESHALRLKHFLHLWYLFYKALDLPLFYFIETFLCHKPIDLWVFMGWVGEVR